jgi:hypothetical protein
MPAPLGSGSKHLKVKAKKKWFATNLLKNTWVLLLGCPIHNEYATGV